MKKLLIILSCIILLLIAISPSWSAEGNDAKPPLISLYARENEVTVGHGCALVIEVDSHDDGEITIYGPIGEQAFNDIKKDDSLPSFDPISDTASVNDFALAVTSYMSAHTQLLNVEDKPVRLKTTITGGEPSFLKADVSGLLIGQGENRIRATLFKNGQPVAVSNTVTISGLPDHIFPSTRDAMIWAHSLPTRHLPQGLTTPTTQSTTQQSVR